VPEARRATETAGVSSITTERRFPTVFVMGLSQRNVEKRNSAIFLAHQGLPEFLNKSELFKVAVQFLQTAEL
jgi:hypothetical protein